MRLIFLLIILSSTLNCCAQNKKAKVTKSMLQAKYIRVDIKAHFGAKGDGKTDDHLAFIKASQFIASKGGGVLLSIPEGTYLVGQQIPDKYNKQLHGEYVLTLDNVQKVVISGVLNKSIIKYKNGLKYGAFDRITNKPINRVNPKANFIDFNSLCDIGVSIFIRQSNDIRIENLILDGNILEDDGRSILIGGLFGDAGWQVLHDGINIRKSSNVTVSNLNVKNFGRDGVLIGTESTLGDRNIKLLNSTFSRNGRQGLSISSVNGLTISNCSFKNTGTGLVPSAPGAGIDIEPEAIEERVPFCKNILIENCTLENNIAPNLIAPYSQSSSNIKFKGVTFIGTRNYSMTCSQPGYSFINCNFFGNVNISAGASDSLKASYFKNCNFSETHPLKKMRIMEGYLFSSSNAENITFDSCKFDAKSIKLLWMVAMKGNFFIRNSYLRSELKSNDIISASNGNFQNNQINIANGIHGGLEKASGAKLQNNKIDFIK